MIYYFCDETDFSWVRSESRRKRFGTFCANSWLQVNSIAFLVVCAFIVYDYLANNLFNAIVAWLIRRTYYLKGSMNDG